MSYAFSATGQSLVVDPGTQLTSVGKFAVWASILSMLFLDQVALNIGDFPVSVDFVCYALFAFYLLVSGYATVSLFSLTLFLVTASLASFRMAMAPSLTASWSSFLLLLALHAPFLFRLQSWQYLGAVQKYVQYTFVSAAMAIAAIACLQIILVNAFHMSSLTNIHFVLPEAIRAAGTYTYTREGGGILKANGFFLRESSALSAVMALAILIEYYDRSRWLVLGLLSAGLICSVSGLGIVSLAAGFLLPRSVSRIPLFFVAAIGLTVIVLVLYQAEIPGLDIWFNRLSEFTTPNTSGYARYVAPLDMVEHSFNDGAFTTWFGNGAGSFLRETNLLKVKYEINDPTWAKLIYEYGLFGFVSISLIIVNRLYSSELQIKTCNFFLFLWLSAGLLLQPFFVLIIWLLTLAPKPHRQLTLEKPLLSTS